MNIKITDYRTSPYKDRPFNTNNSKANKGLIDMSYQSKHK